MSDDPFNQEAVKGDSPSNQETSGEGTRDIKPHYNMTVYDTYMFLGEKMYHDFATAAGSMDEKDRIFLKRVMQEIVPNVSERELNSMEKSYNSFQQGNYNSMMYKKFLEFYIEMEFEKDNFNDKHNRLLEKLLPFFNIVTPQQREMADKFIRRMTGQESTPTELIDGLDPKDAITDGSQYLSEELEMRLNPEACLSRTMMKNLAWLCYTNDLAEKGNPNIDNIERKIINNFGSKLFGMGPEDIYQLEEDMKSDNTLVKLFSYDLSLLDQHTEPEKIKDGSVSREIAEKRARVKDNVESFVRCIKHAYVDGIITDNRKDFLREVGRYFGIREDESYERIIDSVINKKMRVAVINGKTLQSSVYGSGLNNNAYRIMFVDAESMREEGVFQGLKADVVIVDTSTDYGVAVARAIAETQPKVSVYAIMNSKTMKYGQEDEMTHMINSGLRSIAKGHVKGSFCQQRISDVKDMLKREYIERNSDN